MGIFGRRRGAPADFQAGDPGVNVQATVPVRVRMGATKIHGPNSPAVLSGAVAVGHAEPIEFSEGQGEQIKEVDYHTAVEMFGKEKADKLFSGLNKE